jgi:hypothetical protein
LQRNLNHPTIVTIEKVIDETPTVRTLVFSDDVNKGILQYMEKKGYSTIKEMVGLAKKS